MPIFDFHFYIVGNASDQKSANMKTDPDISLPSLDMLSLETSLHMPLPPAPVELNIIAWCYPLIYVIFVYRTFVVPCLSLISASEFSNGRHSVFFFLLILAQGHHTVYWFKHIRLKLILTFNSLCKNADRLGFSECLFISVLIQQSFEPQNFLLFDLET